jgi:hypothetical protein
MRSSRVEFDLATTLTASHLLLSDSPKRVGLIFFPPNGGNVTLSNDTPVVAGNGIVLQQSQAPFILLLDQHGDSIQKAWFCIHSAGATPVSFLQIFG